MNKLIYRGYNITEQNGVYSCEDLELSDLTEDQIYKKIDQVVVTRLLKSV
jgi:hypothetical protein